MFLNDQVHKIFAEYDCPIYTVKFVVFNISCLFVVGLHFFTANSIIPQKNIRTSNILKTESI